VTVTNPSTSTPGDVSGEVPGVLSLTLGGPATFGSFLPGVTRDYLASTTATVISTAADATLGVSDPSSTSTGRLVNGAYALSRPLQAKATSPLGAGSAFAPVGGAASPTTLLAYASAVGRHAIALDFQQSIDDVEGLRRGTYGKTLTFTLSTTTP
jgi:hypothetical protein